MRMVTSRIGRASSSPALTRPASQDDIQSASHTMSIEELTALADSQLDRVQKLGMSGATGSNLAEELTIAHSVFTTSTRNQLVMPNAARDLIDLVMRCLRGVAWSVSSSFCNILTMEVIDAGYFSTQLQ